MGEVTDNKKRHITENNLVEIRGELMQHLHDLHDLPKHNRHKSILLTMIHYIDNLLWYVRLAQDQGKDNG